MKKLFVVFFILCCTSFSYGQLNKEPANPGATGAENTVLPEQLTGKLSEPGNSFAGGYTIIVREYDSEGNLISTTIYRYDKNGNLISVIVQ